jgi:hypothetical protein
MYLTTTAIVEKETGVYWTWLKTSQGCLMGNFQQDI